MANDKTLRGNLGTRSTLKLRPANFPNADQAVFKGIQNAQRSPDAVDILFDTVQKPSYQATAESLQMVEDLALSVKVKVALVSIAPKIQVSADHGKVFISGIDDPLVAKSKAKINTIAMQIEGVEDVIFNERVPREQHGHVNPFQNIG